jgi:hypothetical protein
VYQYEANIEYQSTNKECAPDLSGRLRALGVVLSWQCDSRCAAGFVLGRDLIVGEPPQGSMRAAVEARL